MSKKILALCGSLRAASMNAALLRAAARLAPAGVAVELLPGLGELPLFNPDLEAHLPPPVTALHAEVAASDALVIASPEYAHGVTGTIKNLLDWLVSFEPFVNKPIALFNTSPRAHHADESLREILKTMCAMIVEEASIHVPLLGTGLTEHAIVEDPALSRAIESALAALHRAVTDRPPELGTSAPWP